MKRIVCPICGHEFETRSKTGHTNCGKCLAKIIFDKERNHEYRRAYWSEKREHLREKARQRYQRNREKIRLYQKTHYDHAKAIQRVRKWVIENPEKRKHWILENKSRNYCKKLTHYRNAKAKKVKLLGGKCQVCGYNKCLDALVFHHKDASTKKTEKDWYKADTDLTNLVLLCANCHEELHSKLREETFQTLKEHFTRESILEKRKIIQ